MSEECAVLFKNNTNEQVTVFFYRHWDSFCWISWFSKIIRPGEECLQRGNYEFQYQIQLGRNDLNDVKPWIRNLYVAINGSKTIVEKDLDNNRIFKKKVFQHDDFVKSACVKGEKDLYAILGLKMEYVRSLDPLKQTILVKAAFRNVSKKYHPDKPGGNVKIMQEILFATEVLVNPTTRVRYHNIFDKNGGRGALSKIGAIFWPEVSNEEEAQARVQGLKNRIGQIFASAGLFAAGMAIVVTTGGLALVPMVTGAVVGFGLTSAGLSSIARSFDDECKWKSWGKSAAIGFTTGALTGGALGGVAGGAGVALASMTIGQHIGMGAIAGSIGGGLQSVGSDLEKILNGEKIGPTKVLKNAVCSAAIGTAVGVVGGAISGSVGGVLANTDVDEVAAAAIFRKAGTQGLQSFSESGVGTLLNSTRQVIEERLDWRVENKPVEEHATQAAGGLGKDLVLIGIGSFASGVVSESISEIKYCVQAERMRGEFTRSSEKLSEKTKSNFQAKIRVENFSNKQLTPNAVFKNPRYKLPDIDTREEDREKLIKSKLFDSDLK